MIVIESLPLQTHLLSRWISGFNTEDKTKWFDIIFLYHETVFLFVCLFWFVLLLRARPAAYGIPRQGVWFDLQLPAYIRATATRDPTCVWDPYHSSWQCQILNWLRKARDQTCILRDASQAHECWATIGTFYTLNFWC